MRVSVHVIYSVINLAHAQECSIIFLLFLLLFFFLIIEEILIEVKVPWLNILRIITHMIVIIIIVIIVV